MEIIKTYSWNRRDFSYDAKCEHCGQIDKNNYGYDDANYYDNVLPTKKCSKCKETSISKEDESKLKTRIIPKYDSNLII